MVGPEAVLDDRRHDRMVSDGSDGQARVAQAADVPGHSTHYTQGRMSELAGEVFPNLAALVSHKTHAGGCEKYSCNVAPVDRGGSKVRISAVTKAPHKGEAMKPVATTLLTVAAVALLFLCRDACSRA
jgi:hypothetical protein